MPAQLESPQSAGHQLLTLHALVSERRFVRAGLGRADAVAPALDPAMYTCECGQVFYAPVSTHVICPRCTHDQLW